MTQRIAIGMSVILAVSAMGMDLDENGLDDAWERVHFGVTGQNPDYDHDGDGAGAKLEMLAGTDPHSADSCFTQAVSNSFDSMSLQFGPLTNGRSVLVQRADSLGGDWMVLTNALLTESIELMRVDDPISTQAFYRVSIATTNVPATGTTYYISNSGSDSNDGLSKSNAWQTIAHVSAQSFNPGDQILFRRGDLWREELEFNGSGNSNAWITFSNYGEGDLPKIYGSELAENWTETGVSNIWQSATVLNDPTGLGTRTSQDADVFFLRENLPVRWGHQEIYSTSFAAMTDEFDWCFANNTLYIYSESDPNSQYLAVEVPQRDCCITSDWEEVPPSYIIVDGFDMCFTKSRGFATGYPAYEATGLVVKNCHIAYVGIRNSPSAYGIRANHSDMALLNNEIHDCGRRSISLGADNNNPHFLTNVIIEGNHFYNGYHTTGVDIANHSGGVFSNIVIRNNFFEGTPSFDLGAEDAFTSNHIYLFGDSASPLERVIVFNNVFTHIHGKTIQFEGGDGLVYHNTFYGVNPTLADPQGFLYITSGATVDVKNNIVYNNVDPSLNGSVYIIRASSDVMTGTYCDYNLLYMEHPTAAYANVDGRIYDVTEWADYLSHTGWELHSPMMQDPLFVDPENGIYELQSGSPAIDAGVLLPGFNDDYKGNAPDLGAFESSYSSGEPDTDAPSTPTGLSATGNGAERIDLSWSASTDNVAVVGYYIYRDGSQLDTTSSTAYSNTGLSSETEYVYALRAFDRAGNLSDLSVAATGTTAVAVNPIISASSFEDVLGDYHPPEHAYDGDLGTRWSSLGTNEWIQVVYPNAQTFNTVSIAFHNGTSRIAYFSVEASDDDSAWTELLNAQSSGSTSALEAFTFATSTSRWFWIIGHGSSSGDWNSYDEIEWSYEP